MRSTGWSSGVWGGSANKVILLGTTSPWLLCQLAPSRITTAWASAATWLLISQRGWFIAAVLQIGMISAAAPGLRRGRLCPATGRPHQTNRPRRSRDLLAPPAGCRFAPIPGSSCSSGRCEPRPETIPRLAYRALAPPGLALIAIQQLRKRRLRRRIGLRVARARRQPAQLYPMQQPVGARQAAIDIKLLLQYSLCVDRAKRHYPVPLQLGANDNPLLEPRARHRVYPWLSTRTRPITQSLDAVLFIPVMPFVSR